MLYLILGYKRYNEFEFRIETSSLSLKGRSKVSLYTTLLKPYLWVYIEYASLLRKSAKMFQPKACAQAAL